MESDLKQTTPKKLPILVELRRSRTLEKTWQRRRGHRINLRAHGNRNSERIDYGEIDSTTGAVRRRTFWIGARRGKNLKHFFQIFVRRLLTESCNIFSVFFSEKPNMIVHHVFLHSARPETIKNFEAIPWCSEAEDRLRLSKTVDDPLPQTKRRSSFIWSAG